MATTEYAVKINSKEGALEVTAPEKDWVDAKLEQLSAVFSGYQGEPSSDDGAQVSTKRRGSAKPKKGATASARDSDAPAPRRARGGAAGRSSISEELKDLLTPDAMKELDDYRNARSKAWESQVAQAAIIATFLNDRLGVGGVDQHDLYTVYTAMGWRIPKNIRSQLTNARQRARYFSGLSDGKMILSHAGENFARHDSLDGQGDES